jgi:hypothetical protein
MPFTRITLLKGKSPDYLRGISEALDRAMVESFDVPPDDKFQAFHQLDPNEFVFDRNYLRGPRSDDFILFDITGGKPRTTALKQAFYRRLVALLAEKLRVRSQDVMIIYKSTGGREDWSFSDGKAWGADTPA